MDADLEHLVYAELDWNTPLDAAHAERLLAGLGAAHAHSVLDLGCGWAELLLRTVAAGPPDCSGVGIDGDAALLQRGRDAARARGLDGRVRLLEGDATTWSEPAEVVLCVGAAHAWTGGARVALRALRSTVTPGGRLLFADGCWEREPGPGPRRIFGDDVLSAEALTAAAREAGWGVLEVSRASPAEWDDFESRYRLGRERWAAATPEDPRAAAIAAEMVARREEYETVYRGVLGFAYLVLGG